MSKSIKSTRNGDTFNGFMRILLNRAKDTAKKRLNKGRKNAGIFDLTRQQLIDLYNKQNGRCYYSNIVMSTKPSSHWKCSLERLDNDKGYTIDNVVLCCHEFNGAIHWSKEKLKEMVYKLFENFDYDKMINNIDVALVSKRSGEHKHKKILTKIKNDVTYYKCNKCDDFKTRDEFKKNVNDGCKECCKKRDKKYQETIRGRLIKLYLGAKYSTKRRQKCKKRNKNGAVNDFDITFEDLVEILKKQKGMCEYSGIKMNYGSIKDHNWIASLERKNPKKGYTKDNVCFICAEFNTFDNTSIIKHSNGGSAGWSEDKFMYFIETLFARRKLSVSNAK